MRMIKTCENLTVNSDFIVVIQSVFIDFQSGRISEILDDECNPDSLAFAITAVTTSGEEIVLASYETEAERDFARYKLENWLTSDVSNYHRMTERK